MKTVDGDLLHQTRKPTVKPNHPKLGWSQSYWQKIFIKKWQKLRPALQRELLHDEYDYDFLKLSCRGTRGWTILLPEKKRTMRFFYRLQHVCTPDFIASCVFREREGDEAGRRGSGLEVGAVWDTRNETRSFARLTNNNSVDEEPGKAPAENT